MMEKYIGKILPEIPFKNIRVGARVLTVDKFNKHYGNIVYKAPETAKYLWGIKLPEYEEIIQEGTFIVILYDDMKLDIVDTNRCSGTSIVADDEGK